MEIAHSLQQIQSSYIREILEAASDKSVISLAGGLPDPKTFPIDLMQPVLAELTNTPEVFQYGNTQGYTPLLDYLAESYQLPTHHKAAICTGSQQGLDLIARAYINPGDKIVMEAPSYLGAMQVFGLVQADILTVPQNHQGPDLEALEAQFSQQNIKLFYAVPDFHNPTGVCWSLSVRKRVAQLCIEYDVTLVEDAPYRELRFSGEALPMVSSFCPDQSIVLRSFSKIASPGLRLGVVTGKASYIDPMIKVKQGADLHSSVPMQALLLGLLKNSQFEQHLTSIRELYHSRYQQLLTSLNEKLPKGCYLNAVDGGMFVWLTIPNCDTLQLAKRCLDNKVAVVPSRVFYPANVDDNAALRLNFTNSSSEELTKAVESLIAVLNSQQ